MVSRFLARVIAAAILLPLLAVPSFSFDGQRTDAQAACTYGTRAIQPSDYAAANQFATYREFRDYYNARKECDVSWQWFPTAHSWGVSYIIAGPATMFGYASSPSDPPATRVQVLCNGFDDPRCAAANFTGFPGGGQLRSDATTYHCASDADFNCVASLEVIAPDGTVQQAKFLQHFPDAPKVAGGQWTTKFTDGRAAEQNIASPGQAPALWSYETPEGTRLITSIGMLEQAWDARPEMDTWGHERQNMFLSLIPVETGTAWHIRRPVPQEWTETDANGLTYTKAGPLTPRDPGEKPKDAVDSGAACGGFGQVLGDDGACLVETTFPKGYRYRVAMQLEDFAGFAFMARLDAPVAYSEAIPGGHRYVIEATPAESYLVTANVPKAAMTPEFIAAVQRTDLYDAYRWSLNPVDFPPMENRLPDFISALAPYIGDMSQFKYPAWSFYSVSVGGGMSQTCRDQLKGQVVSITSTNATAYDRNGPTFDQASKTFSFKAAAPHFEPDGKTVAVGHYYMNMNTRFTQCVLGTDKVPDQATVALDYATGDVNVATVAVHTDKDWLRLTADNFHFSSPQIKVQFPAPKVEPKPTSSATAPATTASPVRKLKTITCSKGKVTRKVTAVSPKCPSGWKRKS